MNKALLFYVALPCTQEVEDILNILSITNVQYPPDMKFTEGYGLFIYNYKLNLEAIDRESEWVINDEDAPIVLTLFANKDFNGICEYLNNIQERPFDVCTASFYIT